MLTYFLLTRPCPTARGPWIGRRGSLTPRCFPALCPVSACHARTVANSGISSDSNYGGISSTVISAARHLSPRHHPQAAGMGPEAEGGRVHQGEGHHSLLASAVLTAFNPTSPQGCNACQPGAHSPHQSSLLAGQVRNACAPGHIEVHQGRTQHAKVQIKKCPFP